MSGQCGPKPIEERRVELLKLFRSHFAPRSDDGDEGVGSAFPFESHPCIRANASWRLASFSEMPPKDDARPVFQPASFDICEAGIHARAMSEPTSSTSCFELSSSPCPI